MLWLATMLTTAAALTISAAIGRRKEMRDELSQPSESADRVAAAIPFRTVGQSDDRARAA